DLLAARVDDPHSVASTDDERVLGRRGRGRRPRERAVFSQRAARGRDDRGAGERSQKKTHLPSPTTAGAVGSRANGSWTRSGSPRRARPTASSPRSRRTRPNVAPPRTHGAFGSATLRFCHSGKANGSPTENRSSALERPTT